MAVLGLVVTFSINNSTLCYYCATGLCLPFGHESRERSRGLQLGLSYRLYVADCALGSRKFCMQCTPDIKCCLQLNVDTWCFLLHCTFFSVQLMRSAAVINSCRYTIIIMIKSDEYHYCLSSNRLDCTTGFFFVNKWQHNAEITNSWQSLRCWSLYNLTKTSHLKLITEKTHFVQKRHSCKSLLMFALAVNLSCVSPLICKAASVNMMALGLSVLKTGCLLAPGTSHSKKKQKNKKQNQAHKYSTEKIAWKKCSAVDYFIKTFSPQLFLYHTIVLSFTMGCNI